MSNKNDEHLLELIHRYDELQQSRGLSDAEVKRVSDWMQDIIAVMAKHSKLASDNFGPRWENVQDATLEMFRWFVDFERKVASDE